MFCMLILGTNAMIQSRTLLCYFVSQEYISKALPYFLILQRYNLGLRILCGFILTGIGFPSIFLL